MLGWKCSRVPAGGCERRVPAGERSDPVGSSSAQPGLAEAERQQRGRLGERRESGERDTARQQRLGVEETHNYSRDSEITERGDGKMWSWIKVQWKGTLDVEIFKAFINLEVNAKIYPSDFLNPAFFPNGGE